MAPDDLKTKERRYDLDWLRVIVFYLLILYHVGMYYVPWGFHIKSDPTYPELRWPMLFLNQWRLPILFVISGMGTAFALGHRSVGQFLRERSIRLLIPLLFGMAVIVPPQVWVERVAVDGESYSYWTFWTQHYFGPTYPAGNLSWHHLWFLPYLFMFSLVFAPILGYIRAHRDAPWMTSLGRIFRSGWGLYSFLPLLYFAEALVEPFFPVTHALIGDWFTIINYGIMFFAGYLLISRRADFWVGLNQIGRYLPYIAITSFTAYYMIRQYEDSTVIHFTEAFIKVFNLWSWVLLLFHLASKYLNRPSKALAYANRAVYPFYILHQTVMMLLIYYLRPYHMHLGLEALLLIAGTFIITALIYEFLIRRIRLLHPFFGLK